MSLICCYCSKLGRSNSQSDDEQRHGTGNCQRQTIGDQNQVQTIGDIHVNVTAPNLAPNPEEGPADETNETEYERSVKQILINKRGNLASKISLKYTKLWDFLIQYGVLSDDYARAIQDEHRGERKQARKIIEVIIKRPEKFEAFKRALIKSGQGFIIDRYFDGKVPKMPEQEGISSTGPTDRPRTVGLRRPNEPRPVQENNNQHATTHSDSVEQEPWKTALKENQNYLLNYVDVEHTLLMDAILGKSIMSRAEVGSLREAKLDNKQKVQVIFDKLLQKTRKEYKLFLEALEQTDQKHISQVLREDCKMTTRNMYLQSTLFMENVDLANPELWDEMVKLNVISDSDVESIREEYSDNHKQMVEAFIVYLKKRPVEKFENFLSALNNTGQPQIAEYLNGAIMDKEDWKACLQNNQFFLVKEIEFKGTGLWESLIRTGVIMQSQRDEIVFENKKRTRQVGALIDHLLN